MFVKYPSKKMKNYFFGIVWNYPIFVVQYQNPSDERTERTNPEVVASVF